MIEFIKGKVASLSPTTAVVETVGGVGYLCHISLSTYSALQSATDVCLYVHESIREDAYQLFGFVNIAEREAFRLLLSVSGVGAQTARVIVSALSAQELQSVIMSEDTKTLKTVKGVGQKMAERIIVELRDKIEKLETGNAGSAAPSISTAASAVKEEATSALEVMGYNRKEVAKAVDKILHDDPTANVQQVIKQAFRIL